MKSLRNRVQLIGRLGTDPEVKPITNGQKMARLNLATNEFYYNKSGERVEETNWHNITAFGKIAETIEQYYHKGDEIMVEGRLKNSSYTDKNDEKKYRIDVIVNDCTILSRKQTSEPESA